MKIGRASVCLGILLLVGLALRVVGITRGASDFVLPEDRSAGQVTAFYAFHPDEISLINGALKDFDLNSPPYTSYGTLPPYLLGGLLRLFDLRQGHQTLTGGTPDFRRPVYYVARILAVVFSLGVLLFAALVTRQLYGPWPAVAATGMVAFSPGAIQQAHFFINDGPFALASLAALWAILRACEGPPRWRRFLLAGALIGASACIRFHGGFLGLAFAAVLLLRSPGGLVQKFRATLTESRLWAAGGIAIGLLLLLHPYFLTHPELLSRKKYVGDVALTIEYASGKYLQPWTLVDVDVIPIVSHWLGSWPPIVGWPLTVTFLGGLVWAVWRGGWQERLLVVWCGLYLLPVVMLPARAVRHHVPLLAILAALTVGAAFELWRARPDPRWRRGLTVVGIGLAVHLFVYGTAFAHIYLVEDSRIRAGRFLVEKVRPGSNIAVESGAFSTAGLVSSKRFTHRWLDISILLYSGPYMLCADRIDFLQNKLKPVGAIVYVEQNRAVQYAAVPELFPVAASFYEGLPSGRFGFDVVRRFKTYPDFAGIQFRDDDEDPTFSGYDHPAVNVLLRRDDAALDVSFEDWRRDLRSNPWCPDNGLHAAAVRLTAEDLPGALTAVREAIAANPNALISYRVLAEILSRMGDQDGAREALVRFLPATAGGRMAHVMNPNMVHFVTASTALSLVRLGLYDSALNELRRGLREDYSDDPRALKLRAQSYLRVAAAFAGAGRAEHREAAIRMSLEIFRTADALNAMAKIVARRGDLLDSRRFLEQSILVNARQAEVHLAIAELFLAVDPDVERALSHLDRAEQLHAAPESKVARLRQRLDRLMDPSRGAEP